MLAKGYITPDLELLDMESEGILCESGQNEKPSATVDPWGNGGGLGDYEIR